MIVSLSYHAFPQLSLMCGLCHDCVCFDTDQCGKDCVDDQCARTSFSYLHSTYVMTEEVRVDDRQVTLQIWDTVG